MNFESWLGIIISDPKISILLISYELHGAARPHAYQMKALGKLRPLNETEFPANSGVESYQLIYRLNLENS